MVQDVLRPIDAGAYIGYDKSISALQRDLVWQMMSAGKTQKQMGKKAEQFLAALFVTVPHALTIFEAFAALDIDEIRRVMRIPLVGKYQSLGQGFYELGRADLDLRTCEPEDLEKITGVGRKTSRFFLMGSRPGVRYAILDTHVLNFMRSELGIPTPNATPGSSAKYRKLEIAWLAHCDAIGRGADVAAYDLEIWKRYSGYGDAKQRG
jgi:hypothetical protein